MLVTTSAILFHNNHEQNEKLYMFIAIGRSGAKL